MTLAHCSVLGVVRPHDSAMDLSASVCRAQCSSGSEITRKDNPKESMHSIFPEREEVFVLLGVDDSVSLTDEVTVLESELVADVVGDVIWHPSKLP